ncbi:MAG: transposase [Planctomycetes bacterium]|nr:transposase [Planctomycetota bacterium]
MKTQRTKKEQRSKQANGASAPLLPFRATHGGRRPGAGRKPNGVRAGMPHDTRQALAARFPVHVTVKLREHLPPLRRRDAYRALRTAFAAGCDRNGFRLIHYAVLNDHLHFVVEAIGRSTLSRGVQGLLVRIARTLNRLWQRRGRVFADRYHDHILRSPREVRNALRYVLGNAHHHAAEGRMVVVPQAIDTYTSAPWFDGFRETIVVRGLEAIVRPVTDAHTWLLTVGWRRHGLLSVTERPA